MTVSSDVKKSYSSQLYRRKIFYINCYNLNEIEKVKKEAFFTLNNKVF